MFFFADAVFEIVIISYSFIFRPYSVGKNHHCHIQTCCFKQMISYRKIEIIVSVAKL